MDEHALRKILEGGGGLPGTLARTLLWIPGKLYGGVAALRRRGYETGLLASAKAAAPVISVGNLTAGGSGKTPFTVLLAGMLSAMGRRPGILLRGYRQSGDGLSDEAELYRRLCPDALVEVDPDRRASAARAVAAGADVLLMDDGFQHLRLRRELDIVLVDATAPWGGGNCLPGGLLREPRAALNRAGVVVVTRSDQCAPAALAALLRQVAVLAPAALVLVARHRPARLLDVRGQELPLESLDGRKVVALSGIARPEAFQRTLADLGAVIVGTVVGRDHGHFAPETIRRALDNARLEGGIVVTTEKDLAKQIFRDLADNNSIQVLAVEQEVEGLEQLRGVIAKTLS